MGAPGAPRLDPRRLILLAIAAVFLLLVAYAIRYALLLVYVSILIAVMFAPLVTWLSERRLGRWHLRRSLAVLVIALAVVGLVAAALNWGVPIVFADLEALRTAWPQRERDLQAALHFQAFGSVLTLNALLQAAARFAGFKLTLTDFANQVVQALTALLLAAYFLLDGPRVFRWFVALFPAGMRADAASALTRAAARMQLWVGGQAIMMLAHGGSATIVFGLLRVKYFFALGVFAGLINIIPVLGPVVTVVVAGLVAAIDSTEKLLGVVIFYVIYHSVESSLLSPRIMEARVEIPAVAVLVALVLGEAFAGIVGLLISVPSAVGIAVLLDHYLAVERSGTGDARPDVQEG